MDIIAGLGFGLLILLGLSLVVFLHEGGHFLAARWAGVEVEAFAIGWGKVLWSWKPGTTEYRICLLPLGGYCKMKGEQDLIAAMGRQTGEVEPTAGSLFGVPAWKRIIISAAGPAANLLTALLVFILLSMAGTPTVGAPSRILLAAEVDGRTNTAAEAAGLRSGDWVLAVGGQTLQSFTELQAAIAASGGKAMVWTIEREGIRLEKQVVPQWDQTSQRPLVGVYPFNPPVVRTVADKSPAALAGLQAGDTIVSVDGETIFADQVFFARVAQTKQASVALGVLREGRNLSVTLVPEGPQTPIGLAFEVPSFPAQGADPLSAVVKGTERTFGLLGQMIQGLGRLFSGKEDPVQSLSGPIGIVGQGTQAVSAAFGWGLDFGIATFIQLLAFLSLALFLMNLLPIPALDGGSIVVSIIEGLRRKRLGIKALMAYQQTGVVIVLGLLLFTTLNDLGLFGKV